MSFSIFCRATPRFRRETASLTIGDVFALSDALNQISTAAVSGPAGVVENLAVDRLTNAGTDTSNLERGMQAIGRLHGLHIFRQGVLWMVARHGSVDLEYSLYKDHVVPGWPDITATNWFVIPASQSAPDRLLRRMWPDLQETDLNTGGVLIQMGRMFLDYAEHSGVRRNRGMMNLILRRE